MAETKSMFPDLQRDFTITSTGSNVCSYISDLGKESPILTLVHGYPQSAFEWRHLVPLLKDKVSLFIPELPGYGISTASNDHSKRGVGKALLEALQSVFNISQYDKRKVILGGHDRGARICHRLAVDKDGYPNLNVIGAVLLDIVPTKVQWEAFTDPMVASGYFHWPLLANVDISVAMIKAYGGGKWCREAHFRIGGTNEAGINRMKADDAVEIYAALFDQDDVLRYSAEDYSTGARIDVEQQTEDQKAGRKIEVPTLVMYSKAKLGARQDVEKIWRDWIKPDVSYTSVGVGNGHGHYLPEEACDEVYDAIAKFLDHVA